MKTERGFLILGIVLAIFLGGLTGIGITEYGLVRQKQEMDARNNDPRFKFDRHVQDSSLQGMR